MNIGAVDHVEFYVGDAQQAAFYLCTAFGFRVRGQAGPETGRPDSRSLLLSQGGVDLVLTSALTPDHPAAQYVSRPRRLRRPLPSLPRPPRSRRWTPS
ncbi:VOC family protein, partial [Streptomyces sp. NPDC051132]|uniref:VOC family protein n=1 Tax=Streptomyces sp. NPDC051132 TaxID=3155667 RepID=UPI0034207840